MARLNVAVLISGRGSNLRALMDACSAKDFPAEIIAVVSNVPDAAGLTYAHDAGISTAVIDHREYPSREAFDTALDAALQTYGVRLICLAGFMRLLSEGFVNTWRDRVINVHPSLIPAFTGRNTHERVLKAGVRFTGCTVHFVRPEMDNGPIIIQAAVPVHPDDDAKSLAGRVLAAEHRIYPEAVRLIAENRVRVLGNVVLIDGAASPQSILINPETG
jgi:phosphoribosylglycinamide formyltransferase 1